MDFYPVVVQVVPGEGYTVYAYLNDGSVRLVDISNLIERGGIFSRIADKTTFDKLLTVMNGTVAWDLSGVRDPTNCIDLDPITIYDESPRVVDPLALAA